MNNNELLDNYVGLSKRILNEIKKKYETKIYDDYHYHFIEDNEGIIFTASKFKYIPKTNTMVKYLSKMQSGLFSGAGDYKVFKWMRKLSIKLAHKDTKKSYDKETIINVLFKRLMIGAKGINNSIYFIPSNKGVFIIRVIPSVSFLEKGEMPGYIKDISLIEKVEDNYYFEHYPLI